MKLNKTQKKRKNGGIFGFGSSSSSSSSGNKLMKYPLVKISYLPNTYIQCEICKKSTFYSIDVSVPRSKTATFIFDDLSDIASHPLKMYTCTTCNNCKFMYQATSWNGITKRINERPVVLTQPVKS